MERPRYRVKSGYHVALLTAQEMPKDLLNTAGDNPGARRFD